MKTVEEQIAEGTIRKQSGFLVTAHIDGAQRKNPKYPLLPGDLLVPGEDGEGQFVKVYPGLQVSNFTLSEDQKQNLKPVEYLVRGMLEYMILE